MARPDRAKKLKERKLFSETVVKCCLHKLAIGDRKGAFLQAIQDRVETCSKRTYLASILVNLIVKESVDGVSDDDLAGHPMPPLLDHSFVRQAMLGVDKAVGAYSDIETILGRYSEIKALQDSLGRHYGDANIYSAASKKYQTNLKNHLVLNLSRFMKRIIYSRAYQQELKAAKLPMKEFNKAMLYTLNGWEGDFDTTHIDQLPPMIQESFNLQKQILGPEPLNKSWFKKEENKYRILRYFVYANRFLERHGDKVFNLLPISRAQSHFITIDTHSLYGVAVDAGLVDKKKISYQAFVEQGPVQWASILKTDTVMGYEKSFTGTIETDGVAVCVHFLKKKTRILTAEQSKDWIKELKADPDVVVIGIDPGRSNILFAVTKLPDGEVKTWRLTRSQYYKASGMIQAAKNTQQWLLSLQNEIKNLSHNSPKGVDLTNFQKFMGVVFEQWDATWKEMLHKKWANQKLRLYGGKKRIFASFLNQLEVPKKKTVLAYGSAKFAPGGKNEVSVPTTRAFKECSYRFPTFAVDEFRTTKVYNGDKNTVLDAVIRKDTKKEVRGLLWCGLEPCSTNSFAGKLINRDLNGALNIRDCFVLPKRPPMLTRVEGGPKLVQKTGHWINC